MTGELVVTSLSVLSPLLVPILSAFREEHPEVVLRYLTSDRVFRLEYGEAHVAIRAGSAPEEPDNVVQPFITQGARLAATRGYINAHGMPNDFEDLKNHVFVAQDDRASRAPFNAWLRETVPEENIVFRVTDNRSMVDAVCSGAGIGFVPMALDFDANDLVEIIPPMEQWSAPLWLVTHVDLHRTSKVQAFLTFLKKRMKDMMP